jgi:hypothetical protein
MSRISFKPRQRRPKPPKNRVEFPVAHLVWSEPLKAVICVECMDRIVIDLAELNKQQKCGLIRSAGQVAHDKIHAFTRAHWRCGDQVVVIT